ncbi:MAG: glycosyltransferase family 39 protein [Coleofasciculus sp. G3-WIS-01]|uniref:glycosyltransferase family 39 protein n=1 Tax=Coleofasciculus sp. G3-WIS-01 TaxID=3069528 RepID=UPI003300C540
MSQSFPLSKLSRTLSWVLLSAIAIAVLLRLLNLSSREFWYDEVLSLLLSTGQKGYYSTPKELPVTLADYTPLLSLPVENGIGAIPATLKKLLQGLAAEPHPPLFFLGQHLWLRLFGNGVAATRSLGVLLSIGAIGSAYGFGRRVLGHHGGLLLAALLGTNAYYLFHSLNVRMYGPLLLWVILSAWAALELIDPQKQRFPDKRHKEGQHSSLYIQLLWNLVFIGSITAGFLTFYYFAFFIVALAILVLWLDRQHWWQHGLRFMAGIILTIPWVLWGTRQQLRNADLERFGGTQTWMETVGRHLEGVTQTLGIHLVLGDWVTSLPLVSATIAGVGAIALLIFCSIRLWRQHHYRVLGVALLLGIFPLLLALIVDIVKGQFTVGFGWGRSMIFILPGCLLLIAAWIERTMGKWRPLAAALVLGFYLVISIGDFTLRDRRMFHQIADIIEQEPTTPTLIAINSQAWGHVLRLAYYIPPDLPVTLLAQPPAKLAPVLEKTLNNQTGNFSRVLWLDSGDPIWSKPKTEAEKLKFQQNIQTTLKSQYQLIETQPLVGTMEEDQFTLHLYQSSE